MFRSCAGTFFVCAAAAATMSQVARADLQMSLRATSVNGVPISGAQSAHFIPGVATGDVVSFDVYATVVGGNASFADDQLLAVCGSFRSARQSPSPNVLGTLALDFVRTTYDDQGNIITPGFDHPVSSVGLQQDLDADGDIDVGSNDPVTVRNYWAARYLLAPTGAPAGLPNGARVGFGTFAVTAVPTGGETLLGFFGRDADPATSYLEDGTHHGGPSLDSFPQNGIRIVSVPEPAICGLIGLSTLAARRRRVRRRCIKA